MRATNGNTTTRRQVLTTIAAGLAASAAVPALAVPAADDADRELLEWGAKFDVLEAEFGVAQADQIERELGLTSGRHCDDIVGDMDEPMRAILRLQAKTPAGLAVKARAARYACESYWDKSYADADWDHLHVRALIDAVLQFTAAA